MAGLPDGGAVSYYKSLPVRHQIAMKRAILLAAYGAASNEARWALAGFDSLARNRFPGYAVRWAYTSPALRGRIARAGRKSDSVRKAILRLGFEGFGQVAVQPLHAIAGMEYSLLAQGAAEAARCAGISFCVGRPLLSGAGDRALAASALVRNLPPERRSFEDVVFMGHGARHSGQSCYSSLARAVADIDPRVHIGTMNGESCLEKILPRLGSGRVWLLPLLSVVGRHASSDMAGSGADSWRSRIEAAGHLCRPVLQGLACNPDIAGIWLDHLEEAIGASRPQAGGEVLS